MKVDPISARSNSWCPLPWVHLSYSNRGALRLCSHSRSLGNTNTYVENIRQKPSFLENRNTPFLNEVRSFMKRGEWHPACKRCQKDVNAGLDAKILQERRHLESKFRWEEADAITREDGVLLEKPPLLTLDLRLGNRCNFKCVMCYPGESHRWYRDYVKGLGESHYDDHGQEMEIIVSEGGTYTVKNSPYEWIEENTVYDLIENHAGEIQKIFIAGGEPFLIEKHMQLLERISQSEGASNIELEYSTNLSKLPNPIPDFWESFKSVRLAISLDGHEEVNTAIRYGSQWSEILENLQRVDKSKANVSAHISTTVNLLNIEHLPFWVHWIHRQGYKKIGKNPEKICALHPVYSPEMLSTRLLDPDEIFSLKKRWSIVLEELTTTSSMKRSISRQIDPYLKWSESNLSADAKRLAKLRLIKFIDYISTERNQDWCKISPWFYKQFNSWRASV